MIKGILTLLVLSFAVMSCSSPVAEQVTKPNVTQKEDTGESDAKLLSEKEFIIMNDKDTMSTGAVKMKMGGMTLIGYSGAKTYYIFLGYDSSLTYEVLNQNSEKSIRGTGKWNTAEIRLKSESADSLISSFKITKLDAQSWYSYETVKTVTAETESGVQKFNCPALPARLHPSALIGDWVSVRKLEVIYGDTVIHIFKNDGTDTTESQHYTFQDQLMFYGKNNVPVIWGVDNITKSVYMHENEIIFNLGSYSFSEDTLIFSTKTYSEWFVRTDL